MRSRILFVSGRHADARLLSQMLRSLPLTLDHVQSVRHARAKIQQERYDVVLTEAALPDGTWLDILYFTRDVSGEIEVIVTDATADARLWSEALNLGAYDLLTQPFYEPEVRRILFNACTHTEAALGMAAG